ncbi:MAG: glycosyltransferase family 1 protein [bacterium]
MNKNKKIGLDCRCLSIKGGTRNYALNLIKNLLDIDRENEYYIFYNSKNFLGTFNQENVKEVALNFNIKPLYFIWDQIIVPFFCVKYKINVIHGLKNTVPLITLSKKISTIHDLIPVLFPSSMKFADSIYWKLTFFIVSKFKTSLIFVSNSTKDDFLKLYKTKNSYKVIYHGYLNKNITKTDNKKEKVVLYVGALEKRKNIPRLIEAFNKLTIEYPEYKLFLVGKPGHEDIEIDKQIKHFQLENKVIKKGFVSNEELEELYLTSMLCAYISAYEGFGLPILEAQSKGLPVLTSNTSSMKEIGEGSSLLTDPNNTEEIFQGMKKIIEDINYREELTQQGFKNVERFSWEKCALQTLNVYNEL